MKPKRKLANKVSSRIILGCFVCLSLSSCGNSSVENSHIDQQFEYNPSCDNGGYQILAYEPEGQEFIPTNPTLVAIDVRLSDWNPPYDDTISLNIRSANLDGPILATALKHLGSSTNATPEGAWIHFDLPTTTLVPGSTYVIELQATNISFAVKTASNYSNDPSCNYPNGSFYLSNVQQPQDMYFRTYFAR